MILIFLLFIYIVFFHGAPVIVITCCIWAVQVVSYVLQGRLEEARQMLVKQITLQPAASNMYKLMDTLLSKMPFYNVRPSFNGLSYCLASVGLGKMIVFIFLT